MTEIAIQETSSKRVAAPAAAPGTIWFGAMVAIWSAFVTLLAASPETLGAAYDWLTGLAIVWEIVMWILLLPWALAYVVWESSWDRWLRILIVVLFAAAHLVLFAPRPQALSRGERYRRSRARERVSAGATEEVSRWRSDRPTPCGSRGASIPS